MGSQIRNPTTEIRRKSEDRRPKAESHKWRNTFQARGFGAVGWFGGLVLRISLVSGEKILTHRNMRIMKTVMAAVLAMAWIGASGAGESARLVPADGKVAGLEGLAGQAVDIAPWTYAWRADRPVQEKPEAEFIPRRLERIDKVYRTASTALPPDQLKRIYYNMPDLLRPLPALPKGRLQAGLLWTGGLSKYRWNCVGRPKLRTSRRPTQ